jgi:hypothetical protein
MAGSNLGATSDGACEPYDGPPPELLFPSAPAGYQVPVRGNQSQVLSADDSSGLYYKHIMIVNDDSNVISKWYSKL